MNSLDNSSSIVFKRDLKGTIVYFNKCAQEFFGYCEDEIIGKNVIGTIVPKTDKSGRDLVKMIAEISLYPERYTRNENENMKRDGQRVWISWTNQAICDDDGKVIQILCVGDDITERKRIAEELEKSLSLLSSTLECTTDGILVVNRVGRIVSFNKKFLEMWRIPETLIALRDDEKTLSFVLDQIKEPQAFLIKVHDLYANAGSDSFDTIEFKDGRVFERYSQPQLIKQQIVGRVWSFRDVTTRRSAEQELQESEERYRSLVDSTDDSIYLVDIDCRFLFVNKRHLSRLGLRKEECSGKPYSDFHSAEDSKMFANKIGRVFKNGKSIQYEHWSDREGQFFLRTLSPVKDPQGGTMAVTVVAKNITRLKQMEEELTVLSLTDELTGLYNRRGFLALAGQQIKIATRLKRIIVLLFIDLDDLKLINDLSGHGEGDKMLVLTAKVLKESFRESDIIARIGGDEFVVLMIRTPDVSAEMITQRLRENINANNKKVAPHKLSISIGIAQLDREHPRSIDELLAEGDRSMYEQKKLKQSAR